MKRRFSDALAPQRAATSEVEGQLSTIERHLDFPPNPFGKRLRAAAKAIDSIHGVKGLIRIPVIGTDSRDTNGEFRKHRATGRPIDIHVSKRGSRPELTFVHEIGHFLETTAIPGHRYGERDWAFDPYMAGFVSAVMKTESVAALRKLHGESLDPCSRKYLSYLLRVEELWARCYAQYVATRSANPSLSEQLELLRSKTCPSPIVSQWWDEEFEPVARAIASLFRSIGWNK